MAASAGLASGRARREQLGTREEQLISARALERAGQYQRAPDTTQTR